LLVCGGLRVILVYLCWNKVGWGVWCLYCLLIRFGERWLVLWIGVEHGVLASFGLREAIG